MIHIDKDTKNRPRHILNNRQLFADWYNAYGNYKGLEYTKQLADGYITDDIVTGQGGYCCYCMRRLYQNKNGEHLANITLEHIVPNHVTTKHWEDNKKQYQKYRSLKPDRIEICIGGKMSETHTRLGNNSPIPHFFSYDNIVASCDGKSIAANSGILEQHCCNLKRKSSFVEPIYFNNDVEHLISYDKNGNVVCDEGLVKSLSFDSSTETGVNIMCEALNRIRRFWYLVVRNNISKEKVEKAINDIDLRDDILTLLSANRSKNTSWYFLDDNKNAWILMSEYEWFYDYYSKMLNR